MVKQASVRGTTMLTRIQVRRITLDTQVGILIPVGRFCLTRSSECRYNERDTARYCSILLSLCSL